MKPKRISKQSRILRKRRTLSRRVISSLKNLKIPKRWSSWKVSTMKPKKTARLAKLFLEKVSICPYHSARVSLWRRISPLRMKQKRLKMWIHSQQPSWKRKKIVIRASSNKKRTVTSTTMTMTTKNCRSPLIKAIRLQRVLKQMLRLK